MSFYYIWVEANVLTANVDPLTEYLLKLLLASSRSGVERFCSEQESKSDIQTFETETSRTGSCTKCQDLLFDSCFLLHLPKEVCHHVLLTQELVSSFSNRREDVHQAHGPGSGLGSGS